MPAIDEFALIARYFAPLAARHPGALDLTDDAALFDGPAGRQWAVTTDALVAGVHFLADDPPELIARKLARVNISDLAAMGAQPFAILLAACFPRDVDDAWLARFAAGLKADCRRVWPCPHRRRHGRHPGTADAGRHRPRSSDGRIRSIAFERSFGRLYLGFRDHR